MSSSKLPQLGVISAGTVLAGQFFGIALLALGTALIVWIFLTRQSKED